MTIEYKLNKDNFIEAIKDKEVLKDNVIDLSEIKFADIFGIVSLILLLKGENKKNNKIKIYIPNNINVSNYLQVCGFIDYIKDYAEIKYSAFNIISKIHNKNNNYNNKDYIPIQIINTMEDVELILKNIKSWLKNKNMLENEINKIFTLLLELFGNALDHSDSGEGCIFAMQKYKSKLMISIADFGVGIKESLEKNKSYKGFFESNEEAMKHIFTNKNYISSEDEQGRGNGFFCLNSLSIERNMEFFICSRDGFYSSEKISRKKFKKKQNNL